MYINDYCMNSSFSTEKAGFCQWGFAEKMGHEFFIKKFIDIKYPYNATKTPVIEKKIKKCGEYYESKRKLYDALAKCHSGNIVIVHDFFRFKESYYAVTDKITKQPLSVQQISVYSSDAKLTLIKSILYNFAVLHANNIVHSDVKPENILVVPSENTSYCCPKIIDFDLSFFEGETPEELGGDQIYFAPESLLYLKEKEMESYVSCKIDIFALGILFHEYWTGEKPQVDSDDNFIHEAVLNDKSIKLNDYIPQKVKNLISAMLEKKPRKRISAIGALKFLESNDTDALSYVDDESRNTSKLKSKFKHSAIENAESTSKKAPPKLKSKSKHSAIKNAEPTSKNAPLKEESEIKICDKNVIKPAEGADTLKDSSGAGKLKIRMKTKKAGVSEPIPIKKHMAFHHPCDFD